VGGALQPERAKMSIGRTTTNPRIGMVVSLSREFDVSSSVELLFLGSFLQEDSQTEPLNHAT